MPQVTANGAGPALLSNKFVDNPLSLTGFDWSQAWRITIEFFPQSTPLLNSRSNITFGDSAQIQIGLNQGAAVVTSPDMRFRLDAPGGEFYQLDTPIVPGTINTLILAWNATLTATLNAADLLGGPQPWSGIPDDPLIELLFNNSNTNPSVRVRSIRLEHM